MFRIFIY